MSSNDNADFDDILENIAKDLYKKTEINALGKALGCGRADIGRCNDANAEQGGTHMGTLDMLRTWQQGQTRSTKRTSLRGALLTAGFKDEADKYLGPSEPEQHHDKASLSCTMATASSAVRREVTSEEISKLSILLPDGKYSIFGTILGFDFAYHQKILKTKLMDYTACFEVLLQEWKTKKGGFINDLDVALGKADVGGLITKYKI